MTDDLLARARQACDRAPEGPWEFDDGVVWRIAVRAVPDPRDETGQTPMPEYRQEKVCDTDPETAEFIAAARTLIPELIDALTDARDVKTIAQLDALPDRVVVIDRTGTVWEKDNQYAGADEPWWSPGTSFGLGSDQIALPARVIHMPESS